MAGFLGRFLFLLFWAELLLLALITLRAGFFTVFLLCILSAIAGGYLVRRGGLAALFGAVIDKNGHGVAPLLDGVFVLLAGLLLIFPGFISDVMALALLIPAARRWVSARLPQGGAHQNTQKPHAGDDIIEGDFVVVNDNEPQIERPRDGRHP